MKTSSPDPAPAPAERSKAWSCLVTNLVVLPGLGSVMAGRKIAGYVQMLLAIGGSIVAVVAAVKFILLWARDYQLPADAALYSSAIIGIAVFIVSWCWSLLTSLAVFRQKP